MVIDPTPDGGGCGDMPAPAAEPDDDFTRNPMEGYGVLVVGLGNLLLRDDGVGVHAARQLMRDPPPGALVVEVGTAILSAVHLLETADKILALDAVHSGGTPGTAYLFDAHGEKRDRPWTSVHELGILNTLALMAPEARPQLRVIGVEPEVIDYGLELSPTVARTLDSVVAEARRLIADWLK
jgi:hydrogenase maturation protease